MLRILEISGYCLLITATRDSSTSSKNGSVDMFYDTKDTKLLKFRNEMIETISAYLDVMPKLKNISKYVKRQVADIMIVTSYYEQPLPNENTSITPEMRLKKYIYMHSFDFIVFCDIDVSEIPVTAFKLLKEVLGLTLIGCAFRDVKWINILASCLPNITDLVLVDCDLNEIPDVSEMNNLKLLEIRQDKKLNVNVVSDLKLVRMVGVVKMNRGLISDSDLKELRKKYKNQIDFVITNY